MNSESRSVKIAVVDDHHLFRSGLIKLVQSFGSDYKVILEANNGKEFLSSLENNPHPEIVLMDLNMPVMDGFETSAIMQKKFPQIKVLVITMLEDERTMIKMLKLGIRGYLSKDIEPGELRQALNITSTQGFYYTDRITGQLVNDAFGIEEATINAREQKFLELACSEYTYKEIADQMGLSFKTIDGYRDSLFNKLKVKSRVGLVLYAIKNNLVRLS